MTIKAIAFRDVDYDWEYWEYLVQKFLPGAQLVWGQGYDLIEIRASQDSHEYTNTPVCSFECIDPDGFHHIVMRCFSCGAFVQGRRCDACGTDLASWEPVPVQVEDWDELEEDNALCGIHNLAPARCLECGDEFYYSRAILAHAVGSGHQYYRLPASWDRIA